MPKKPADYPTDGSRANVWHTLRVEFLATRIKVALDGRACIELEDKHISGPGAIGVWTKADSVTEFDDFRYGSLTT